MKEIGGYFGLEEFTGREYYDNLIGVNTGRNALLYILKAKQVKKLWIPRFLCDTVYKLCLREGVPYEEYPIGRDFLPLFSGSLGEGEYLYIVNFYGQITNEMLLTMRERWGNVIFDNAQAFFQRPVPGIDTVYTCRKFFGVPDGAYAATDRLLTEELPFDLSAGRMKHILGRFEESGSAYYADFQENDESFYELELRRMSALTRNILRGIDYGRVRQRRNENYDRLAQALGAHNGLKLKKPDGPYCYPFYCENGMAIKKALAKQKIYVATLWPNMLELTGTLEADYAQNILPLPCDQRYDSADMDVLIDAVLSLIG